MTATATNPTALPTALRVAVDTLDEPHLDRLLATANAATTAAFGPRSTIEPVEVGANLWALVRTSPDGAGTVLCVHNVSNRACTFTPEPFLPARPGVDSSLRFLLGDVRTESTPNGLVCHVGPRSFVWISRVAGTGTP